MTILYKYRPFDDYLKPVILTQKIWFPTRLGLNDPEDLQLKLVEDIDAQTYRQFLLKKAARESWPAELLHYNLENLFAPNGDLTTEATRRIASSKVQLQKYLDVLGILSLSDKDNAPILWDRYANEAQGVCLVFHMQPSEYLLKVKYETPRPQPKLSVLLLSDRADQEVMRVLGTKTEQWSDESEWRCFVRNGNELVPFLGRLAAIRLGKKMLDANRQTLAQWVAAARQPIAIDD